MVRKRRKKSKNYFTQETEDYSVNIITQRTQKIRVKYMKTKFITLF